MKHIDQAHLPVIARTHPGMTGKNNEDRFAVSAFVEDSKPVPVLLAVLSDGIGGHRAGEIAAELAVNTISHLVAGSNGENPIETLSSAIQETSQLIFAQSQTNNDQIGMGATISCAYVQEDRLYTATVGDSRIYLIRGNRILQLSTDHTWIQEALDSGLLRPDQVKGHPNSHVIRRFLGSPIPPQVDTRLRLESTETNEQAVANQGMQLKPKDTLLLCSDGLTDLVSAEEIQSVLSYQPMELAAQTLIDMANQRGGHDNITLILIQVPTKAKPKKPRLFFFGFIALVSILLLVGTLFAITNWLEGRDGLEQTSTPTQGIPVELSSQTEIFLSTSTAEMPQNAPGFPQNTPTSELVLYTPSGPTLTAWPTNTLQLQPATTKTP
ncbi:MAG: serine/threonine-protein phosphatase [Anaerolineaceae bacterium]|nr:serine/threonine-protein phosphatase [Anaerolineaceae bacterium]